VLLLLTGGWAWAGTAGLLDATGWPFDCCCCEPGFAAFCGWTNFSCDGVDWLELVAGNLSALGLVWAGLGTELVKLLNLCYCFLLCCFGGKPLGTGLLAVGRWN